MPLRRRRGLGVRTGRACPRRVRATGGLDEDVASRHAAFLHDMLDRKLGATARVEFTDDRTFQGRPPWLDQSANNRPARARFLNARLEPNDPEHEQQRESDQPGDQQRTETSQPIREKEEHASPILNVRAGLSSPIRQRSWRVLGGANKNQSKDQSKNQSKNQSLSGTLS